MGDYSNDFEKIYGAKNLCNCNQIRSNQITARVNAFNHFLFKKSKIYQISDIKDNGQKIPASTLLQSLKDISLI